MTVSETATGIFLCRRLAGRCSSTGCLAWLLQHSHTLLVVEISISMKILRTLFPNEGTTHPMKVNPDALARL